MKRIMLRVAYDGTEYCGWQVQPNGITVEAVLNRELSGLLGENIAVIGASRTDSGVHALGNVCVFDTESRIPGEKFSYALNARLPQDIVVQESKEVPQEFHPRHCDCNKTYEYRIYNAVFPNPLQRRYSHFIYRRLDAEAMRRAAAYLAGEHDFKSFCSVNTQVKETVRTVNFIEILESPVKAAAADFMFGDGITVSQGADSAVSVKESQTCQGAEGAPDGKGSRICRGAEGAPDENRSPAVTDGSLITIRINGNGFLYNMVRIIAGTLIEIGYHWYEPEKIQEILEAKDRAAAGATAPACGLTLLEINYPALD